MRTSSVCFTLVSLALTFAACGADRICPNQCRANRQAAVNDCNNFNNEIYALCEVVSCQGGFSCSFPSNSFLIDYDQFANLEMVIEYTWSPEHRDLDTSTRLMGSDVINVGFSCPGTSPIMSYGGDVASYGGTEYAVIDLQDSAGGLFDDSVAIHAHAGWHGTQNHGPARVSVYMRGKADKVLAVGTVLSTEIYPGTQSGCANKHVATVVYFHGNDNTRITLSRA